MDEDKRDEGLEFDKPEDIGDEEMAELTAWAGSRGITPDNLRGADNRTVKEKFGVPLVFLYEDSQQKLVFRQDLGLERLLGTPRETAVDTIAASPRLTLKRALQTYGSDLLAYERVYRITSLEVTGMTIRKRVEYSVQLMVRKSSKAS